MKISQLALRVFNLKPSGCQQERLSQNLTKENFFIYLESQVSFNRLEILLNDLIKEFPDADERAPEITPKINEYFAHRWELINGTSAAYSRITGSLANSACTALALHLGNPSDKDELLQPFAEDLYTKTKDRFAHDIDETKDRLPDALFTDSKSRSGLLSVLSQFPQFWGFCAAQLEYKSLVALVMDNSEATFEEIKTKRDLFTDDVNINKLLLFFLFEIYKQNRILRPAYDSKTWGVWGPVAGYLGCAASTLFPCEKTYSCEEKTAAAIAVQDYLTSDKRLADFNAALTNVDHPSSLYKHAGALKDGVDLPKFVAHIQSAIETRSRIVHSYSNPGLSKRS